MTFTRTSAGVSNLHLFYDAELMIFTEGGTDSFSLKDVDAGKFSTKSVDIKFWSSVFKANNFDKKIEFRAIGSKTASKSICERIIDGSVKNVAVARDRDLDECLGALLDSPFILHTKGYSWENDVYIKNFTLLQIESMIFEAELPKNAIEEIDKAYKDFISYGKHLVKLEAIFRAFGIRFISDIRGEQLINNKSIPAINKSQVKNIIEEKKKYIKRPINTDLDLKALCPLLNNYGKLLSSFSLTLISYICKKYSNYKAIPKQVIDASMIDRFFHVISLQKDDYYSNLIENLKTA